MAAELRPRRGETAAHARLKRLALIWAQAHGYQACALEVHLPRCHFRADVAAFREEGASGCAAVFECKQALCDLRRDNCDSIAASQRLQTIDTRREIIERNLRVHYPTLGTGNSLFPQFEEFDFSGLNHRGRNRVTRDGTALRQRMIDCTKFEKLSRYCCANLFYLVLAEPLRDIALEMPSAWGLLIENGDALDLVQKPAWHDTSTETRMRFLRRVARAATREVNRQLAVTAEEIQLARRTVT
jgi:hypothetical protein